MIDIKPTIGQALTTNATLTSLLGSGERIFYMQSPSLKICPCIVFSEEGNRGKYFFDNAESASEIVVYINIFASADTHLLADCVNTIMEGLGFVREYSRDLPKNNDMYQKHMRFKTIKEV